MALNEAEKAAAKTLMSLMNGPSPAQGGHAVKTEDVMETRDVEESKAVQENVRGVEETEDTEDTKDIEETKDIKETKDVEETEELKGNKRYRETEDERETAEEAQASPSKRRKTNPAPKGKAQPWSADHVDFLMEERAKNPPTSHALIGKEIKRTDQACRLKYHHESKIRRRRAQAIARPRPRPQPQPQPQPQPLVQQPLCYGYGKCSLDALGGFRTAC